MYEERPYHAGPDEPDTECGHFSRVAGELTGVLYEPGAYGMFCSGMPD